MTFSQVAISPIAAQEMRARAVDAGVNVPIEQTWVWANSKRHFLIGTWLASSQSRLMGLLLQSSA